MAELRTLPPATSDFPAPMDDATKREVLSSILAVRAPPDPTVRGPLCLATLQALHLATRAPAWPGRAARGPASAPPAAADVAAHAETIAEAARDAAASPDPHLRATGLLMAAAAVGCDATGLIADELYRTDVPRALLRGMAEEPLSALQEAGRSGDSTGLLAIEGALALLQVRARVLLYVPHSLIYSSRLQSHRPSSTPTCPSLRRPWRRAGARSPPRGTSAPPRGVSSSSQRCATWPTAGRLTCGRSPSLHPGQ